MEYSRCWLVGIIISSFSIQYSMQGPGQKDESSKASDFMIPIIIVVGATVLFFIIIVIILCWNSRNRSSSKEDREYRKPKSKSKSGKSSISKKTKIATSSTQDSSDSRSAIERKAKSPQMQTDSRDSTGSAYYQIVAPGGVKSISDYEFKKKIHGTVDTVPSSSSAPPIPVIKKTSIASDGSDYNALLQQTNKQAKTLHTKSRSAYI